MTALQVQQQGTQQCPQHWQQYWQHLQQQLLDFQQRQRRLNLKFRRE